MENNVQQDEKQEATKLCVASLICYLLPILTAVVIKVIEVFLLWEPNTIEIYKVMNTILGILVMLEYVASVVLVINVRVKYPENTFGKVLMWIYIITFIVAIIGIVIFLMFCGVMIVSCIWGMQQCTQIG